MYTIKCAALQFRLSKSQKKTLKKFKRYIESGEISDCRRHPRGEKAVNYESSMVEKGESLESRLGLKDPNQIPNLDSSCAETTAAVQARTKSQRSSCNGGISKPLEKREKSADSVPSWAPRGGMKAKAFRRERWRQRQLARGMEVVPRPPRNAEKSLEERLSLTSRPEHRHRYEVRMVATNSDTFTETFAESLSVYQKYQVAIHGDTLDKCSASQFKRFLCKVSELLVQVRYMCIKT
jgi:arginine-tRNA-protein transferase